MCPSTLKRENSAYLLGIHLSPSSVVAVSCTLNIALLHITSMCCSSYRPKTSETIPMIRENRQLVTDEPVEFEKKPVEVQDSRRITDHFRRIYGIYLKLL